MSKFFIASLMAGGLLFARNHVRVNAISSWDRDAVSSQSPRVKTQGMNKYAEHKKKSVKPGYRVVNDKTTIDAFVPRNK